jgi:hypothetical protein
MTNKRLATAAAVSVLLLLQGCAATTHFEAVTPGTVLTIKEVGPIELPKDQELKSKSTGQHEFMATSPTGQTLYGILPLRVNGGHMATSIVLFAPALFIGGFRDAFPAYQVDVDAGVLRYKGKLTDLQWREYRPSSAESSRAKAVFDHGTPANPPAAQAAPTAPAAAPEPAASAAS